jgi:hypothetical protein
MNHKLIDKKHKTPLGIVTCGLTSDNPTIDFLKKKTYENGRSEVYRTNSFLIELIEFKIRIPLYNGENLTDSQGWIWRIIKKRDDLETIQLNCNLIDFESHIEFDTATGEHLDAIEASDNDWILHIGTEDGEVMNSRAKNDDWFPERLQHKVDFYQSITEMEKNGFKINIPDLQLNERLHIQFICAFDKRTEDKDKVNTWLAVDEFKGELEKFIGINNE